MRERFLKNGLRAFTDHEILEFLLFYGIHMRDTNEIAHDMLSEFGNLENVLSAPVEKLTEFKYVNERAAVLFNFIFQLNNRLASDTSDKDIYVPNVSAAGEYCCRQLGGLKDERLIMLSLNAGRKLIKTDIISDGNTNTTFFDTRKIIELTLLRKANGVILAHNHPGGTLNPSTEDIVATSKLSEMLDGIGVLLIDHLLCSKNRFASMFERGFIE